MPEVDPLTAASALGGAQLVVRVLGPTAEYLGDGFRDWVEHRVRNVKRIFENADRHLSDEPVDGRVSPRVLQQVLQEGSFIEDELAAEYLGGVLASSRLGVDRDDRGALWMRVVTGLSSYQIRAHHIMYSQAIRVISASDVEFGAVDDFAQKARIFIPWDVWQSSMGFVEDEDSYAITTHVMNGLLHEELISRKFYAWGDERHFQRAPDGFPEEAAVIYVPSTRGAELALWSIGRAGISAEDFFDPSFEVQIEPQVSIADGSVSVLE